MPRISADRTATQWWLIASSFQSMSKTSTITRQSSRMSHIRWKWTRLVARARVPRHWSIWPHACAAWSSLSVAPLQLTPVGLTVFRGIHAVDRDKPNTANSDITYSIVVRLCLCPIWHNSSAALLRRRNTTWFLDRLFVAQIGWQWKQLIHPFRPNWRHSRY